MDAPTYTVAVRSLCEFTAKAGDLDRRFTPSPTAQEGIAGHKLVASRRPDHYEREVTLTGRYRELLVRGRADGYDPKLNRVEEIKTFRGALDRMPDNHRQLHWAQARVYGWLLCQQKALPEITVALVYHDIGSQEETVLTETRSAADLEAFFDLHCARFLDWARQEIAHRQRRDNALAQASFPHGDFRTGQRPLAESVYRAAVSGRCLLAQAPTGIGKTIGTIFPALKAMPAQKLDKLFFLTAKTSGRQVALDALARINASTPDLRLRVIEINARDQACEYPGKACHGDACPLAAGFYDRLPAARAAALGIDSDGDTAAAPVPGRVMLRQVALAHQVCPYYLTQELTRWADAVVADYNYYFDMAAMLFNLVQANDWRVTVLVDEAHNMVERARRMYSATLDEQVLERVQRTAPASLRTALAALARQCSQTGTSPSPAYETLSAFPAPLRTALQTLLAAMSDYLAEHPAGDQPELLDFYFDALHFARLSDTFEAHSLFDISAEPDRSPTERRGGKGEGRMHCIRNIVPAPFLRARFAAARSVTLFSATLSPEKFYRDTLGLPDNTVWVDVPSPFDAAQLSVQIVERISTRYTDRHRSLLPIAELMATQFHERRGNYLAFFSSFDYLEQVRNVFAKRYPEIPRWMQSPRMDGTARQAFLERFGLHSEGIGFAVLGGSFAEGIDLPGDRLIGAFIATLGLPQLNPVNEQMMQRMQTTFDAGFDYTYLFPGIQKVVQAAGRVIRTQEDRGVVYLIDDRFTRAGIRKLLPVWWDVRTEKGAQPALPETTDAEPAIPHTL